MFCVLIRLESRGGAIFTQDPGGARWAAVSRSSSCARWSPAPSTSAPGWRCCRATTRITRTGAFLRRYSLDELPNLWNVVRGEMSIVGPRPTLMGQVELYTERQRERLLVRPGITGWAQVNGRASLPWSERIELDVWYVEHRTLWLDLRILALTARMVFGGHGLYHAGRAAGVDLGPRSTRTGRIAAVSEPRELLIFGAGGFGREVASWAGRAAVAGAGLRGGRVRRRQRPGA